MFLFLREKIASRIHGWAHRHLSFGGRLTLIKSTLKAIPLHILQAIEPTSGALRQLEQQIARFFWGATMNGRKTHWISWDQVCLPTSEGGLGIRKFEDILKAFSLKMWWRFREQSSLWATHLMNKYCSKVTPLRTLAPGRSSHVWRRLMRAWPDAHPHIRWVVGDGSTLFWDDIWLKDVKLRDFCLDDRGSPLTRIADFWHEGKWCLAKLQLLHTQAGLPQEIINDIKEVPILTDSKDSPRWNLTSHGDFKLASAWEIQRARRPVVPILEDLWNDSLTPSMSIFMWRLLSNRIPVDSKLQWRKISLASKCLCCPLQPSNESLRHLFVEGQAARKMWLEFDRWFQGSGHRLLPEDSIPDRMLTWARRTQQKDINHISRILPSLICWFLWAERNNSRHNGTQFRAHNIRWQILWHLRRLNASNKIKHHHWRACNPPPELGMQLPPRQRMARIFQIKWIPPDPQWLKLNTASIPMEPPNRAAGGGVLRNHRGELMLAFTFPINGGSPHEADLQTITRGLQLASDMNCPIWIETDAQQLIPLITTKRWGPANSRHAMARLLMALKAVRFRASYIPRQGNKAGRFLALRAAETGTMQQFDQNSAPQLLKALIRLEQLGLPNFGWEGES